MLLQLDHNDSHLTRPQKPFAEELASSEAHGASILTCKRDIAVSTVTSVVIPRLQPLMNEGELFPSSLPLHRSEPEFTSSRGHDHGLRRRHLTVPRADGKATVSSG
jgi:hypothetical protein